MNQKRKGHFEVCGWTFGFSDKPKEDAYVNDKNRKQLKQITVELRTISRSSWLIGVVLPFGMLLVENGMELASKQARSNTHRPTERSLTPGIQGLGFQVRTKLIGR